MAMAIRDDTLHHLATTIKKSHFSTATEKRVNMKARKQCDIRALFFLYVCLAVGPIE